ncbi:S9 family peptidase [Gilvimarinus agarilyticus]|uniref:S9 family peptidase n=1 Tax=Gilvimarinus sp. 2_MG-2023 TaxID=3062666 RepID=UPI001C0846D1|nr:S9 family peptidase [Gilvimarinus sp. 2_MG-2023]MBU2886138.1 S9 family peptidase [Gilvimarinus agarilyticus]MDO6570848.1 S9 family peptidase [Gilvimarinus sp. 2_MG-2023]
MSTDRNRHTQPFGTWPSPISASTLTSNALRLSDPQVCEQTVYWIETRADEGGRSVLMQQRLGGEVRELLDASASVRSRAHEYGGAAYLATPEAVFAVFDQDERVYKIALRQGHSLTPVALTDTGPYRYTDFSYDPSRQRLIAVREDHSGQGEERADIVAIDTTGEHAPTVLITGEDFYSNPRLSPDGRTLAWLSWTHPNMPWDSTQLHLADVADNGELNNARIIAGNIANNKADSITDQHKASIFQPSWSPEGELFYVSDTNGWWNLHHFDGEHSRNIVAMEAEFATPQWVFGMSTYSFIDNDKIICCFSQNGLWSLGLITRNKTNRGFKFSALATPLTDISALAANSDHVVFLGASTERTSSLYHLLSQSIGHKAAPPLQMLRRSQADLVDAEYFSAAQAIEFPTSDGETCHGFYYPPVNPEYCGADNQKPPLLVICHGGPTGATSAALNYKVQFWTSRGFAVLDVNYRGSTGYGRPYRDRLKQNWGVTDVIDVASGAQHLVDQGLADKHKLIIRGSSAGGYTVLAALTFTDTFAAGASLYGIGDLSALADDTHKFESRYLDSLIGPYPEQQSVYQQRSPLHHIDQLTCPVIFLQGLKDKIVPPAQAEKMVQALQEKGIATEYVTFADEGHGFRSADAIEEAFGRELNFYIKHLQLTEAG